MASTTDTIDADPRVVPHPTCANCATPLAGDHCHGCGQPAHIHRSVAAIGHDLWHGVLHLDGKLAHTLPLLALKPAQLTRRYIAGERRRFVSPMGMFLFSVTVLFLAMQMLGVHPFEIDDAELAGPALARAEASLINVAEGEGRSAEAGFGLHQTRDADGRMGVLIGTTADDAGVESTNTDEADGARREVAAEVARARTALPLLRQARNAWGDEGVRIEGGTTGSSAVDGVIQKLAKDPALVAHKVQANSYKFSWALIPLSVPFVWLLFFWRRDLGLYDHTVFVTYSLATITLMSVAAIVLVTLGVSTQAVGVGFCLLAPAHIWVHLRGSYGLSKRATLWRFLLLSGFIWLAVGLFAIILFALGALG